MYNVNIATSRGYQNDIRGYQKNFLKSWYQILPTCIYYNIEVATHLKKFLKKFFKKLLTIPIELHILELTTRQRPIG